MSRNHLAPCGIAQWTLLAAALCYADDELDTAAAAAAALHAPDVELDAAAAVETLTLH